MTILHVYSASDTMAATYVQMLSHELAQQARMLNATTQADIHLLWQQEHPDMIHMHGAPGFSLPAHCRLIVTPHGQTLDMRCPAYVVVARSAMESKQLSEQSQRIAVVLNPIITQTTTPAACAAQMLHIYRRVGCSDVLQLMSYATRRACCMLLLLSITGDARWLPPHAMDSIRQADMTQMAIYATHEGIKPMVNQALAILGMSPLSIPSVESYLPPGFYKPVPMPEADIPQLLAHIREHGPSMLRLAEVARALRSDALNEDILHSQLQNNQTIPLFEAVLQLLIDIQMLTEGFIPSSFQPRQDNALRQALISRQSPVAQQ